MGALYLKQVLLTKNSPHSLESAVDAVQGWLHHFYVGNLAADIPDGMVLLGEKLVDGKSTQVNGDVSGLLRDAMASSGNFDYDPGTFGSKSNDDYFAQMYDEGTGGVYLIFHEANAQSRGLDELVHPIIKPQGDLIRDLFKDSEFTELLGSHLSQVLGKRITEGLVLPDGEEGEDMATQEQVSAAVAEQLPVLLAQELPKVLPDAVGKALPSFLPNWAAVTEAAVKPLLSDVIEPYRLSMAEAERIKALQDDTSKQALETAQQAKEQAEQNAKTVNDNSQSLMKNLDAIRDLQKQVADGVELDKKQQGELAELLRIGNEQYKVIKENVTKIQAAAEQAQGFEVWADSIKEPFVRLERFIDIEYDQFVTELGKATADAGLVNNAQDIALKAQSTASEVLDILKKYDAQIKAADETVEIQQLTEKMQILESMVQRWMTEAEKQSTQQVETVKTEEAEAEPDPFADDAGMM